MVDVEHRRLPALENHRLPGVEGGIDLASDVGDHRAQPFGVAGKLGDDGFDVDLFPRAFQQGPLLFDGGAHTFAQKLAVENVLDANAQTRRLIRVCRADPPPRRAYLARPQTSLAERVEDLAKGCDDVRIG